MKKQLIDFCLSLNIEYVGIAPVGPYEELAERWSKRLELDQITGFEEKDFLKRIDARQTMDNAQSVIVCLFPYFTGSNDETNLSKSSFSTDYHRIVKSKLEQIGSFLEKHIPGFQYNAFVDNGPLSDRYMAYLAGLGYFGINSHIINDQYGSYVFIGYLINNYAFEIDQPVDKTCMQCCSCVGCCPGCAIPGNFDINPLRCRSYITQKKGELSEQDIDILSKSPLVFGCDICQDVCPHNKDISKTPIKEFKENLVLHLDHKELQAASNKEFLRKYGDRAFSWRGKGILMRNFDIVKKHE